MNTIADINPNLLDIPRFDDGMVNMNELIRSMAESVVNEIMNEQADIMCEEQGNSRNGYRERALITSVGKITLRIPKVRVGSYFPEDMLIRYSRVDQAVIGAISEMVTNGLSTRKVQRVANQMGITEMSASQVSRMCSNLDEIVADLQQRSFEEAVFPYLWLDATYIKARNDERKVCSSAVATAIGAASDGHRVLLGLDSIDTESYAGWLNFLKSIRKRGVKGVVCVVSDSHEGLKRAIEEVFPDATWQRCIVHLMRNCTSYASTRRKRAAISSILSAVFSERDPDLVRKLYHLACDEVGKICPAAGRLLEEAEPDALAYLDFPYEHHIRLRTNNVQERTNREIKRRSRVVQVFPSKKSLIRFVGAALAEIDEQWAERRWFSESSMLEIMEKAKPVPPATYDGTAVEHAEKIMQLVLADNGKVA